MSRVRPQIALGLAAMAGIVLLGVVVVFLILSTGSEPEGFGMEEPARPQVDVAGELDALDLDAREAPTIREWAAGERVRKVVVQLGPGKSGIDVTVANDGPVAQGGGGIAVRTTEWAMLLNNTAYVTVPRPDDCANGCVLTFWITTGQNFADRHLDAELVIYAGSGAEARIDEIERLPPNAHGGR